MGEKLDSEVAYEPHGRVLQDPVPHHGQPRAQEKQRREKAEELCEKRDILVGQRLVDDYLEDPWRRQSQERGDKDERHAERDLRRMGSA
jgi:hypothetical protein